MPEQGDSGGHGLITAGCRWGEMRQAPSNERLPRSFRSSGALLPVPTMSVDDSLQMLRAVHAADAGRGARSATRIRRASAGCGRVNGGTARPGSRLGEGLCTDVAKSPGDVAHGK